MLIVLIWIVGALIIGAIASDRTLGFWGAFLISLIFSPLIGLLFTLLSKTNKEENYRKSIQRTQKSQLESLEKLANIESVQRISIADEIEKLEKLKINNSITEDEFLQLKNNLIGSTNSDKVSSKIDAEDKSYTNHTSQNSNIKQPNFFKRNEILICALLLFILPGIYFLSKPYNSDNDILDTDSEIVEPTSVLYSDASEEIILKNFTFEDIARFAMATSMQEPIEIIKSSKKDEYYYVTYVRPSDSQKFEFKVKFEGNKIFYGDLHGRWQDTAYDEKLSFEENADGLSIITTYSDGSTGEEKYKKGD